MDKSFWLDKWQKNQIGFHLSEFHPLLQKYCAELFPKCSSVFVPLCGKSRDMSFLQSQGYFVVGSELSPIAAEEFFAEQHSTSSGPVKIEKLPPFIRYRKQNIDILVGDFFNLSNSQLNGFQCIYDRAALIALPKEMRKDYVAHLTKLLPKATMLLITLDYDQKVMSGPPFSVEENEVEQLFSFARIEKLHRRDIIEQEPRFKDKGLNSFYQTAYQIKW